MGLNPLLGRHTIEEVAPVTYDEAAGTLTVGSYTAINAYYRQPGSEDSETALENINGFGFNANPVPIEQSGNVEIAEILRNQIAPSVLRGIYNVTNYIAIRRQEGSVYKETHICVIARGGRQFAKGTNLYSLSCQRVETGAANPTLVIS